MKSGQILLCGLWILVGLISIHNPSSPPPSPLLPKKEEEETHAKLAHYTETDFFPLLSLLYTSLILFPLLKFWDFRRAMVMAAAESQFHVLAVDDSIIDRKLIERLLKTSSYQVTTVDSGSKALEFLGLHEDDPSNPNHLSVSPNNQEVEVNLVITDYCMPGMTGYDLLKKIKESSSLRNIPVVIMSSENVPSRINRCLEEGAEEFFLKPVRLADVNKLKPHMMKTKCQNHQKQENQEQEVQESTETSTSETSSSENSEFQSQSQDQQPQQQSPQPQQPNNNKRKSLEEGLSPERTRPRYSGLTLVSN